jgi:hypothetical protein
VRSDSTRTDSEAPAARLGDYPATPPLLPSRAPALGLTQQRSLRRGNSRCGAAPQPPLLECRDSGGSAGGPGGPQRSLQWGPRLASRSSAACGAETAGPRRCGRRTAIPGGSGGQQRSLQWGPAAQQPPPAAGPSGADSEWKGSEFLLRLQLPLAPPTTTTTNHPSTHPTPRPVRPSTPTARLARSSAPGGPSGAFDVHWIRPPVDWGGG